MNKLEKELAKYTLEQEAAILKRIEKQYKQALKDVKEKISVLKAREDIVNNPSIIYQMNYQKAVRDQIKAILDNMKTNNYTSIMDYLQNSYTDGFIGSMYDLHGQKIPLIIPIDQEQMVTSIINNTKLSKKLYDKLGEDITELNKQIQNEVSRGISNNYSYDQIAKLIDIKGDIYKNKAYRIARTEGHRIQEEAKINAMSKAKAKGANIVKQWDASLDKRTRPAHAKLDGQIRELEEEFEGGALQPGGFGIAAMDINCRCTITQRAKWALDEEELDELKKRAKYYKLDKSKDFDDFKEKYLKAIEQESITKHIVYAVNSKMLDSREFISKFDKMSDDKEERRMFLSEARKILKHRSGTNGEDLVLYNTTTKKMYRSTISNSAYEVKYNDDVINAIKKSNKGELISFHNHPGNSLPSISDLNSAHQKGYRKGYVLCHNGTIYEYTAPEYPISSLVFDKTIEKLRRKDYNKNASDNELTIQTLNTLATIYNFIVKEVK